MSPTPADSVEALQAYARTRGLSYYDNWSIPEATQLLHHGSFADAPRVLIGELPGGMRDSWLAHFVAGPGIKDGNVYTVVVVRATASAGYAVRLLCHDRDLPRSEATNPDAERETVPMDDREIRVESEAFLRRYDLRTDHDQDQVRAWQLFDPSLLEWLTKEAPEDFSFELQDGALCGFVPGAVTDPDRLDALCEATARIRDRVLALADDPERAPVAGGRAEVLEREFAAHPFSRPPRSTLAAAWHMGGISLLRRSSRRLGLEAFFRAHATRLGLAPIEPSAFLATHIEIAIPGAITQVARGHLHGTELDGYLVFTTDDDKSLAWTVAISDISNYDNGFAFVNLPQTKEAEARGFDISSNGSTITVWKPDRGPYMRSARALRDFCATAFPLLEAATRAAKR